MPDSPPAPQSCARCGHALPQGFLGNTCPACLLLAEPSDSISATEETHTIRIDSDVFIPPVRAGGNAPPRHDLEVIGPYRLIERLGEGGFGIVWRAEQTEPIRREVALKVIKPGMASEDIIRRFEAERQTLAIMNHPGIARIFEGGLAASGNPFFAMELVSGSPITQYCDVKKLSLRQRLELFRLVCSAITHAHQKGILHRDIKPTNILVTEVDGVPVPKVIDFGIAKALHQTGGAAGMTVQGSVIGTPIYMSPEQFGSANDIDTRSDIYSLGVVLYELLAGALPFDEVRLRKMSVEAMCLSLRTQEATKPSSRITKLSAALAITMAQKRGFPSIERWAREITGDLEWIIMKALEKNRERRYQTVTELADDIACFLTHQPVKAGPPGIAYRMKKYARRNRVKLALAAAVIVLGGAAWGVSAKYEHEARTMKLKAQKAAEESRQKVLELEMQKIDVMAKRAIAVERARTAELAAELASQREESTLKLAELGAKHATEIAKAANSANGMAERALVLIRDAYQQSRSPVADFYVAVAAAHPRLKQIVVDLIEARDQLDLKMLTLDDQRKLEVHRMVVANAALDAVKKSTVAMNPRRRKSIGERTWGWNDPSGFFGPLVASTGPVGWFKRFPRPPNPYQDFHPQLIRLGLVSRLWERPEATTWRHIDLGLAILRLAAEIEASSYGEPNAAVIWYARAEWVFQGLLDRRNLARRNGRDEFSTLRPPDREQARSKPTSTSPESSVPVPGQTPDPVDDLLLGKIIQLCIDRQRALSTRDFKSADKYTTTIPALTWIPRIDEFASHRGGEPLTKLSVWEKDPGLALLNQPGKAALAELLKWEQTPKANPPTHHK